MSIAGYELLVNGTPTVVQINYKDDALASKLIFTKRPGEQYGDTVAVAIDQGRGGEDWEIGACEGEEGHVLPARKLDLRCKQFSKNFDVNGDDWRNVACRLIGMNADKVATQSLAALKKVERLMGEIVARENRTMYECIKTCSSPNGEKWLNDDITNAFECAVAWDQASATPYKDICNATLAMIRRGGDPNMLICSPDAFAALTKDQDFKDLFNASVYIHLAEMLGVEEIPQTYGYIGGSAIFSGKVLDVVVDNSISCPVGFVCLCKAGCGVAIYNSQPMPQDAKDPFQWADTNGSEIPQLRSIGDLDGFKCRLEHEITFYPENAYDLLYINCGITTSSSMDDMKKRYYLKLACSQGFPMVYAKTSSGALLSLNGVTFADNDGKAAYDIAVSGRKLVPDHVIMCDGENIIKKQFTDIYSSNAFVVSQDSHGVADIHWMVDLDFVADTNVTLETSPIGDGSHEIGEIWTVPATATGIATFSSGYKFSKFQVSTNNGATYTDLEAGQNLKLENNVKIKVVATTV